MNITAISTFGLLPSHSGFVSTFNLSEAQTHQTTKMVERGQSCGESYGTSPNSPTTSQQPTADGLIIGALGSSNRYKTELCRPFEELGKCRYGDKCQFAHGADDLRTVERHPKHKTELCRSFHTTGLCPYGARCHFIHNEMITPQKQPGADMMSGLAGILAASIGQYRTVTTAVRAFGTSLGTFGTARSPAVNPTTGFVMPPVVSTSSDGFIPASPGGPAASRPVQQAVRPTPPCPILSLEMEMGSIAQRRRQMRGSVDSPTGWSMSGSSLSSGSASSSSSPITSFLDDAFSPPPTSGVFSPPIGQYVGSRDYFPGIVPTSNSSVSLMLANANKLQENLKPVIHVQQQQQAVPTFEQRPPNIQTLNNTIRVFSTNAAIQSNLGTGFREGDGHFGNALPSQISLRPTMHPAMFILTEDLKALNLIGQ